MKLDVKIYKSITINITFYHNCYTLTNGMPQSMLVRSVSVFYLILYQTKGEEEGLREGGGRENERVETKER